MTRTSCQIALARPAPAGDCPEYQMKNKAGMRPGPDSITKDFCWGCRVPASAVAEQVARGVDPTTRQNMQLHMEMSHLQVDISRWPKSGVYGVNVCVDSPAGAEESNQQSDPGIAFWAILTIHRSNIWKPYEKNPHQ